MSKAETIIDLSQLFEELLHYTKGKGQIPDLPRFVVLVTLTEIMYRKWKVRINWKVLLKKWSINAPAYRDPLWLKVIDYVSRINQRVEMVTQVSKRRGIE